MATRDLTVYVVRHGEREDSMLKEQFKKERRVFHERYPGLKDVPKEKLARLGYPKRPCVDSFDPLLTAAGHRQAQESFAALTQTLPDGSRVAVFSSPLRRAIGTSLMMGSVVPNKKVEWPLPHKSGDPNTPSPSHHSIPITVIDELGDFARLINCSGGTDKLVPEGKIRCASMNCEDESQVLVCHEWGTPIMQALAAMPSHSVSSAPIVRLPVQYWKDETDEAYSEPMSYLIDPCTKIYSPESDSFRYPRDPPKQVPPMLSNREGEEEYPVPSPLLAVDRAVYLASERGCDVCIIVAHREAIRDMKKMLCRCYSSTPTPYCCIGSFSASINEHGISYKFWNVWTADNFSKKSIPRPIVTHDTGTIEFIWLEKDAPPHTFCVADARTMGGVTPKCIWLSTRSHHLPKPEQMKKSKMVHFPIIR